MYEKINVEHVKKPEFALFVEDVCMESKKPFLQVLLRNKKVLFIIKKA